MTSVPLSPDIAPQVAALLVTVTIMAAMRIMKLTQPRRGGSVGGRVHVRGRFLGGGNWNGKTFVQWIFEDATDDEFRVHLRVSRQVFAFLETELAVMLRPSAKSFRTDTATTREKIAIALHWLGTTGNLLLHCNFFTDHAFDSFESLIFFQRLCDRRDAMHSRAVWSRL